MARALHAFRIINSPRVDECLTIKPFGLQASANIGLGLPKVTNLGIKRLGLCRVYTKNLLSLPRNSHLVVMFTAVIRRHIIFRYSVTIILRQRSDCLTQMESRNLPFHRRYMLIVR